MLFRRGKYDWEEEQFSQAMPSSRDKDFFSFFFFFFFSKERIGSIGKGYEQKAGGKDVHTTPAVMRGGEGDRNVSKTPMRARTPPGNHRNYHCWTRALSRSV